MLEATEVHIYYDSGQGHTGYRASIDPSGQTLNFAPRPDAPPSATAALGEVKLLRFVPTQGSLAPLANLPAGGRVTMSFPDGHKLNGRTRPVPLPGGVWLHPDGEPENVLVLVPYGAAPNATFERGTAGIAASQPAPFSAGGDRRIATNPFEAPTVGEMEALDPAMFNK